MWSTSRRRPAWTVVKRRSAGRPRVTGISARVASVPLPVSVVSAASRRTGVSCSSALRSPMTATSASGSASSRWSTRQARLQGLTGALQGGDVEALGPGRNAGPAERAFLGRSAGERGRQRGAQMQVDDLQHAAVRQRDGGAEQWAVPGERQAGPPEPELVVRGRLDQLPCSSCRSVIGQRLRMTRLWTSATQGGPG